MPALRTALVTSALVLALSACGGNDGADGTPATAGNDGLRDAAEATAANAPAYTPLTKETFGRTLTEGMLAKSTVHSTGDLGGDKLDLWMRTGNAQETAMKGSMGGSEILLVDGHFYTKAAGEKKWSELPAEFSKVMLRTLEEMSPARAADEYAQSLEKLTYQGVKEIDGLTLHSYALELDPEYALRKAQQQAAAMGADAGKLTAKDLPTMDIVMMLDAENLMRRLELTTAGTTVVMKFDGWGEKVGFKAPSKSEIQALVS